VLIFAVAFLTIACLRYSDNVRTLYFTHVSFISFIQNVFSDIPLINICETFPYDITLPQKKFR